MSNADRKPPDEIAPGPTAADSGFSDSTRKLLLTLVFDLAAQHVRRYRQLDSENLSHEIGISAYEQLSQQPAAREKVRQSLKDGTEEWKRVAHMCVIHARAEKVKRELVDRHRRLGTPVEDLVPAAPRSAAANELMAELRDCVDSLDKDRQTVIRLRFERGMTFQEIAEEMQWNKTRVYGCYATALVQLERSLKAGA
ncbi:MAG: hypothetical protein HY290_06420 [Planctomycetia bacterium]|nr:hypothetical protein [Planctomycetia bacterium]